jgi:hypothetical protein
VGRSYRRRFRRSSGTQKNERVEMKSEATAEAEEEEGRPVFETDPFYVLVFITSITGAVLSVEFLSGDKSEYIHLQSRASYVFLLIVGGRVVLIRRWYNSYKEFIGCISGIKYKSFTTVSFFECISGYIFCFTCASMVIY